MLFGYSFVFSVSLFIPMSGDSVQHEHMSICKKHSPPSFPLQNTSPRSTSDAQFRAHPVGSQAGSQDLGSVSHALAPGCASAGGTGERRDP